MPLARDGGGDGAHHSPVFRADGASVRKVSWFDKDDPLVSGCTGRGLMVS